MITRPTLTAGLIGAGVALVLLWLVAVSYGAYRGHLAASFLERELARIQQAAAAQANGPGASSPAAESALAPTPEPPK